MIKDTVLKRKTLLHSWTEDNQQSKAFSNIIKFFAIMLVLTFLARGTAGAALAKVTLGIPLAGTVTNNIEVDGKLDFANSKKIIAPLGLQIEKLLLEPGEAVESSQQLVLFEKKSTDVAIKTTKAEIDKLYAQCNILKNEAQMDDFGIKSAQDTLNWAIKAQDALQTQNNAKIDIAVRKYNTSFKNLEKAREWSSSDEDEIAAAQEELNLADDNLKLTELTATDAMLTAEHNVAVAQTELTNVLTKLDAAKKQHDQTAQSNLAEASLFSLEIESKKEILNSMQEIQKNEYFLLAPQSGKLTGWTVSEGQSSTGQIGTIADESDGYIFTFPLSKEQSELVNAGVKLSLTQKNNSIESIVSYVKPQSDGDSSKAVAKIPKEKFKAGTAQGTITLSENDYSMCIPSTAIHKDNHGTFVYVVEEKNTILGIQNIVSRMEITLLEQSNNVAAISGAFLSNGKIIISTSKAVKIGDRVRIIE